MSGRRLWLHQGIAYRPAQRADRTVDAPPHMWVSAGWVNEDVLRWDAGDDIVDHLLKVGTLVEAPAGEGH